MTTLVLVAASGLAAEVAAAASGYDQIVAVDDDRERWGTVVGGAKVIGPVELVSDCGADLVVCAGSGRVRRRLVERLLDHRVAPERFATVVHPDASVADGCEVGPGSVLLAGARLTAQVTVGQHVVVMPNVVLTHDDIVEDFATVCAGVALGGEVVVGEAAYLGMNSSVRQRLTVGAGAVLGMGAVLLEDLPAGETWAGVPARPLRVPV
ncbi:NeuD/PglB/VioB family sugar acetyltransferase [Nocardioides sp. CCNWLW239]|uniref:NeuD/PglB/VioB family sugar acetyltransferase n=1 Tax=Nocardioides sp. CCNWLW239 TaxID=3128902 RepID=UPI00301B5FCB